MTDWAEAGKQNGWLMPSAAWWKRLPLVRHVRALLGAWAVERWYRRGPGMLGLRTGYDKWVLWGIFHGQERAL